MHRDEVNTLWRISAICMGAAMPAMLLGKAITSILLILALIFGMMATKDTSIRSSVSMFMSSTLAKVIFALLGAFTLSSLFSIDPNYSLEHTGQMAMVAVGAFFLFVVLREMPSRYTSMVMRTLVMSTLVVMILCILDATLQDERLSSALHGKDFWRPHRLNFMSPILAILLPFMWAWMLKMYRESEVMARYLAIPLVLLGGIAVFLTGGRAGWLAFGLAGVVFLGFASRYHGIVLHKRHWGLGILTAGIGLIGYGYSRGYHILMERIQFWNEPFGVGSGRDQIWSFAIEHMDKNPVTGIGVNAFRKLPVPAEGIASNAHPHNFIIQLFLETGALGLIAGLVLWGLVFKQFWHGAKADLYALAGLSSFMAFSLAALFSASIFNATWLVFAIVPALIAYRMGWRTSRTLTKKKKA
ncbi:MAG: O-antigen ligase family protein [Pseudomonadota bacterium]|nr:O-antigen ligase family protein [Pseudomonadota bacterium]